MTPKERAELMKLLGKMDERGLEVVQLALELLEQRKGLRPVSTARIIPDAVTGVDTANMPYNVRVAVGRTQREHPASKAWLKAGKTVGDIAKEIDEGRPRVNSWLNAGAGNRPIPRKHAEYFKATYKIPLSAWRRIAD